MLWQLDNLLLGQNNNPERTATEANELHATGRQRFGEELLRQVQDERERRSSNDRAHKSKLEALFEAERQIFVQISHFTTGVNCKHIIFVDKSELQETTQTKAKRHMHLNQIESIGRENSSFVSFSQILSAAKHAELF